MIFDSLFHMIFLRTNFMAGINHVINIMSKKQNGGFFDQQFALGIVANFSFRISPKIAGPPPPPRDIKPSLLPFVLRSSENHRFRWQ